MKGCCNGNSTQYERNRWFRHLVFALGWSANGAKLPSAGLWLNASKSESTPERNDAYLGRWQENADRAVPQGPPASRTQRAPSWGEEPLDVPPASNLAVGRAKSLADDSDEERGIVSSRVASLLRSSEIKPSFSDLFLDGSDFASTRRNATYARFDHVYFPTFPIPIERYTALTRPNQAETVLILHVRL